MTFDEFNEIKAIDRESVLTVSIDVLQNKADRTLLWGFDSNRDSHHLFVKDEELRLVVYSHNENMPGVALQGEIAVSDAIPNKRLYPEACDTEFCRYLAGKHVDLPFTNFQPDRDLSVQYHGATYDDAFNLSPKP